MVDPELNNWSNLGPLDNKIETFQYTPKVGTMEPENQPLEVWRFLLEIIILRFHVKLWGVSHMSKLN